MVHVAEYNVMIEVIEILGDGKCSMEQKIGDVYNYPEDMGKMCPSAFYVMYPLIVALQLGASHPSFGDNGNSTTIGCTDYRHQVVYKITRNAIPNS